MSLFAGAECRLKTGNGHGHKAVVNLGRAVSVIDHDPVGTFLNSYGGVQSLEKNRVAEIRQAFFPAREATPFCRQTWTNGIPPNWDCVPK
jgi:hypothetical protein